MFTAFILAATLSAPAAPVAATSQSTESAQVQCLAGVNGDLAAEHDCLELILKEAEPMRVDQLDPKFSSSCLVIPTMTNDDLIWTYLDWLSEHPDVAAKPASITINSALLEKIPCGWSRL